MSVGRRHIPYLLAAPGFITIFVLTIYPSLYCLVLSLYSNARDPRSLSFVGLANFAGLFRSAVFWNSVGVTVKYTVIAVFLELALGLGLALLLHNITVGRSAFRALLALPLAVTPAISALTWRMVFSPTYGVLNGLLNIMGLPGGRWHTGTSSALGSVILVDVWQWTPFMMLILFAAVQMLPKEVYEAAALDGASARHLFWKITLPLIGPVASVAVILRALDAFRSFDIIFVLTKGGPGRVTETLVVNTFIEAFYNYDLGRAAAMSVCMLIVTFAASRVMMRRVL